LGARFINLARRTNRQATFCCLDLDGQVVKRFERSTPTLAKSISIYALLSVSSLRNDTHTPPNKGQAFLWDGEIRGFGVRVVLSSLKTFVVQYRNVEGRTRRMTIGRYGLMTVEQARDQAKVKLGAVAGGADPAAAKASASDAITVTEVFYWYLAEAEAGRILGRRHRPIKTSTLAMDRSRIETHIKPLLGRRQVRALKLGDVEAMQSDIASGRTAKPRGVGRGGATTGGAGVAAPGGLGEHSAF
jgi:hypothetical protein